ncbi:cation:proton antiporter [Streptomyces sp. LX-29]|uniref:cation:proton antiporter domain-containing protein n=1 Tax=Streptomyces sp. LX-29 TaxID=2900152 RepID=UPI00321BC677
MLAVDSQILASRLRVPSLIVLLPVGFTAGALTEVIHPDRLVPDFTQLVSLAVAVILYDAGLGLELRALKGEVRRVVARLIMPGVLITWGAGLGLVAALFDVPFTVAVMIGVILVVSGPTVVGPLLDHVPPTERVRVTPAPVMLGNRPAHAGRTVCQPRRRSFDRPRPTGTGPLSGPTGAPDARLAAISRWPPGESPTWQGRPVLLYPENTSPRPPVFLRKSRPQGPYIRFRRSRFCRSQRASRLRSSCPVDIRRVRRAECPGADSERERRHVLVDRVR